MNERNEEGGGGGGGGRNVDVKARAHIKTWARENGVSDKNPARTRVVPPLTE